MSLCQQSENHTRQHIAATGSRHSIVAPRTACTSAVGRENARTGTLHNYSNPLPYSHLSRHPATVFLIAQKTFQWEVEQTGKLSKVRCEYRTFRKQIHKFGMQRQNVQRIGIEQQRHCALQPAQLQLTGKGLAGGGLKPQTGTDSHRTIGFQWNGHRKTRTVSDIVTDDSFRYRNLNDVVVATGDVHRQFTHSRTQTGPSGKYRSTGHAPTSGNEQRMTESRLVPLWLTGTQHTAQRCNVQIIV